MENSKSELRNTAENLILVFFFQFVSILAYLYIILGLELLWPAFLFFLLWVILGITSIYLSLRLLYLILIKIFS